MDGCDVLSVMSETAMVKGSPKSMECATESMASISAPSSSSRSFSASRASDGPDQIK